MAVGDVLGRSNCFLIDFSTRRLCTAKRIEAPAGLQDVKRGTKALQLS